MPRADFPVLEREINGHPLVYLDSAASAQKPRQVIEAMERFYSHSYGTVHRGVYELGREATELFEGARERIAAFVGWDTDCSIFTRNATEAINLVAYAWGRGNVGAGDEVLITEMEHHSNIVPWQLLCEETGARLRYLSVSAEGELSLDELDAVLAEGRVKLVAVAHVSNVLGTINPVEEIARARPRRGRGHAGRRCPGRAPDARGPARDRRRLLRLDRPQGARPHRRACCTAAASCSRRCAPSSAAGT